MMNATTCLLRQLPWWVGVARSALGTVAALGLVLIAGAGTARGAESADSQTDWLKSWRTSNPVWRGVHLLVRNDVQVEALAAELPRLAGLGVNVIVLEVDYNFQFRSHPEIAPAQGISAPRARALAQAARQQGLRLIPQLNCLGHQSWAKTTDRLLEKHPEFDETPGQFPDNQGIYCRSWCPQNAEVNAVVFALIDELCQAFEADAFHVGMDEVFLIAAEYCPRCRGGDPAKLFAKAVNDLHSHIVAERKLDMLMWGDRLLDSKALGYSEWEAARNGTHPALDLIPADIIICDWHYGKQAAYPSVPLLLQKGFRVWPSGWQPLEATKAFSAFARQQNDKHLLGYLCTTWGKVKIADLPQWPPVAEVLPAWR
jgi:hypothetical protein